MEVILLERIEKLGQMGDVVNVKPGYARNFLLPQKKALRATETNRTSFESQRAQLEADNLDRRNDATAVAERLDGLKVVVIRSAGESGQLYGSVNARDIASGVTEAGFTISRQQVVMDRPVKLLGFHDFRIRLHPEVDATITINVARTEDEAETQERLGRAVISTDEDEDEADPEAETLETAAAAAAEVAEEAGSEEAEETEADTDSETDSADESDDSESAEDETAT
jgi:large subunit ribosomal protein L9